MYFFNRNRAEIPKWFYRKEAYDACLRIAEYLCLDEEERRQTLAPVYKTEDLPDFIIRGLAHATVEKCAFCEQRTPDLTVHLFRPSNLYSPKNIKNDHQDYYIWESLNWNNMFPICRACQSQSTQSFPVLGKHKGPNIEEFKNWKNQLLRNMPKENAVAKNLPFLISYDKDVPRIIEPSDQRDMKKYFRASFNGKFLCHKNTGKGPNTISTFQLNRTSLCRDRVNYISARLHQLGDIICNSPSKYERNLGDHFEFSTQEFSTYYYLILRRLGVRLKNITRVNGQFDLNSIKSFYSKVIISRDQFDDCLNFLKTEDHHYEEEYKVKLNHEKPLFPEEKTVPRYEESPSPHFDSYPRLKSVRIQNFKSLEFIELNFPERGQDSKHNKFAPCLLILGENSTGKSSILEAICYASLDNEALKKLNINSKRIVLDPRYMGSEGQKSENTSQVKVAFHSHEDEKTNFNFEIEFNRDNGQFKKVNAGPKPLIFAYGAHRLFGDERKYRSPISNVETLFNNNVCTTNPESWLINLHNNDENDFNNVIAAIREVIQVDGLFSTIDVVPKNGKPKDQHCEIKLKRENFTNSETKERANSHIVPMRFDIVSSGYRVVLALICDVFSGIMTMTGCKAKDVINFNAIVMIDEIEAHLHPRWKLQIISGLRTALPNVTFIFTSHDPLCIRGMYQGEVMVLNRFNNREGQYDGSSMNEVVEQITEFPNVDALTVDQLLTSDLFNLYSADSKRMDKYLAHIADIVSNRREGDATFILSDGQKQAMAHFQKEIVDALPIGDSELTMLVQEAVAEFLAQRRQASGDNLSELRKSAKEKIISHLKDFIT